MLRVVAVYAGCAVLSKAFDFTDPADIDGGEVWEKLESAFGARRLTSTFDSPGSLVSAILTEQQETAGHVGCSINYDFGVELGKWYSIRKHAGICVIFFNLQLMKSANVATPVLRYSSLARRMTQCVS